MTMIYGCDTRLDSKGVYILGAAMAYAAQFASACGHNVCIFFSWIHVFFGYMFFFFGCTFFLSYWKMTNCWL